MRVFEASFAGWSSVGVRFERQLGAQSARKRAEVVCIEEYLMCCYLMGYCVDATVEIEVDAG